MESHGAMVVSQHAQIEVVELERQRELAKNLSGGESPSNMMQYTCYF